MAEQQLYRAQIGAAGQEMRGERMPQEMRMRPSDPGSRRMTLEAPPEAALAQAYSGARQKQGVPRRRETSASRAEIAFECRDGAAADGDHPFLRALASNLRIPLYQVNVLDI